MFVLTSSFRGYDRKQVMAYLDELHQRNEEKIRSITDKIGAIKHERELFNRELSMLRQENERNAASRALFELALKRVVRTVGAIDTAAGEEIQGVRSASLQRVIVHKNRLVEVESDIKKTRTEMEAVMQKVLETVKINDEGGQPEEGAQHKVVGTILSSAGKSESIVYAFGSDMINANQELIGKLVVSSNGMQLGHVGKLIVDESAREIKGFLLKGNQTEEDCIVRADSIMAVKKDSLVVAANYRKVQAAADEEKTGKTYAKAREQLQSPPERKMTADGTTVQKETVGTSPANSPAATNNTFLEDSPNLYQTAGRTDQHLGNSDTGEVLGGYWETVDSSWETGVAVGEHAVAGIEWNDKPQIDMEQEFLSPANLEASATVEPAIKKLPTEDNSEKPAAGTQGPHPVVEKAISSVWHKYIVGKLAGEDLLDEHGLIILRKGEPITSEVVDRAEQVGKIAELIVHMAGHDQEA